MNGFIILGYITIGLILFWGGLGLGYLLGKKKI